MYYEILINKNLLYRISLILLFAALVIIAGIYIDIFLNTISDLKDRINILTDKNVIDIYTKILFRQQAHCTAIFFMEFGAILALFTNIAKTIYILYNIKKDN